MNTVEAPAAATEGRMEVKEACARYVVEAGMRAPKGYKQTEVGVIPEDWESTLLGTIATVSSGGTPSRKVPEYWNGDVHWVTTAEIDFNVVWSSAESISSLGLANSAAKLLQPGTMLMALYGQGKTRGKVAVLGIEAATNQACASITVTSKVSQVYVFHLLASRYDAIRGLSNSGSQDNLSGQIVKSIGIPLPPTKAEQEAIAEVLNDADALIESLEQILAKKRQIKQGTMQELLTGKQRLPGFSGEWEVTNFDNIADPTQRWSFTGGPFGSNLKSSDYTENGVRIIQLQNIGDGEFKDDYEIFTSPEKADELLSCNIFPGEIILSKMGDPVARACIIPKAAQRYLMCSDGIRLAVDPKRFNVYFVYTLINAPEFRTKAANAGTGSTRKRIGLSELRNLELSCPPLAEQTAIATLLSDMDAELAALEVKLAKARQLKQGMMQELLTGRIRLI